MHALNEIQRFIVVIVVIMARPSMVRHIFCKLLVFYFFICYYYYFAFNSPKTLFRTIHMFPIGSKLIGAIAKSPLLI